MTGWIRGDRPESRHGAQPGAAGGVGSRVTRWRPGAGPGGIGRRVVQSGIRDELPVLRLLDFEGRRDQLALAHEHGALGTLRPDAEGSDS
jgi:hypothetical protein